MIPSYRDAERVRDARGVDPPHGAARDGANHRRRRRQRPRARRGAARDRGHRGRRGRRERGLRRERQPRPARRRPRARRGRAELRHRGARRLAGVPAVRGLARRRTSGSSARSCSIPTGASSSPGTVRNLGAPEWFDHRYRFKPEDWGPAGDAGPGAGGDGRVHVRHARGDRAGRAARRALPDGLRGRRLVPARLAGGAARAVLPGRRARSTTSRSRAAPTWASASAPPSGVFWERWGEFFDARDVRTRGGQLRVVYVTEGTGVGGGHRDIFEHLNRLLDRGHEVALYTLGERARLVRAARARAQLRGLRGARGGARGRSTRSRSPPGGTPPRRCGARACCTASPCTSCRTSRPPTTPTTSVIAPRGARLLPPGVPLHDDLLAGTASACASWGSTRS